MDVCNYRPISILTSFSKMFEKVIYNRLLEHAINDNILATDPFGFRKIPAMEKTNL
jgi:tRNA G37 N-methylase TrmD